MVAEIVVPCADLDAASAALGSAGFCVDLVIPADDPATIVMSGHGLHIRLVRGGGAPSVRLPDVAPFELGALRVQPLVADAPPPVPQAVPSFTLSRARDLHSASPFGDAARPGEAGTCAAWHVGRAGMQYRDLIPDRQGGRFIASHIRIPDGGPVPDYVHYHRIHFQLIYCYRGWVRVVYEDQGEPFVMNAGDCVVQPPEIRHRVLEASPGLEVIEVGCPALHETRADRALALPTAAVHADRDYSGQRFVWHRVATATRTAGADGEVRDLGVGEATRGVARARVVRGMRAVEHTHAHELMFGFVLHGHATLTSAGTHELGEGDAFVIPRGQAYAIDGRDAELLEVTS